jgi:hypothetical protein
MMKPLMQWVPGVKLAERVADHSPVSSAEVQNGGDSILSLLGMAPCSACVNRRFGETEQGSSLPCCSGLILAPVPAGTQEHRGCQDVGNCNWRG